MYPTLFRLSILKPPWGGITGVLRNGLVHHSFRGSRLCRSLSLYCRLGGGARTPSELCYFVYSESTASLEIMILEDCLTMSPFTYFSRPAYKPYLDPSTRLHPFPTRCMGESDQLGVRHLETSPISQSTARKWMEHFLYAHGRQPAHVAHLLRLVLAINDSAIS